MKILFVDIDTMRPDHLGCYGYKRNTSPNIDEVAKEGVRFDNYYCSDAPCLPSRASLISGRFGIRNGVVGHGGTAADRRICPQGRGMQDIQDVENFINIFRRADMYTASISTFAERHSAWWFNAGFNECFNEGDIGLENGDKVTPYALDWLEQNGTKRKDWFLHVHYWDPHTPYRVPMGFGNPFENEPLDKAFWMTEEDLRRHQEAVGPHCTHELNMFNDNESDVLPRNPGQIRDMEELKKTIDGYDCGVRYMDSCLGQIMDKMKDLGIYDECAIVITSDHGENFGELGVYSEHGTADKACCNIPMIIKWPGCKKGTVDKGLHYNLDILPTACDLLDVDKADTWDGESYVETLKNGTDTGRDSLVISQMAHVCQRSARFGDWLYMRTIHDGFHLFDDEMLFNLKDDPYEQKDVKKEHPEICAMGAKIILDWTDEEMKKNASQIDPMWTVYHEGGPFHASDKDLPGYTKRLRETGRADKADALEERHLPKEKKMLESPGMRAFKKLFSVKG
ncbi:MAG: sulfatase [Oribacterium sp.]|nr:sulfatase [Oribacterium sp.]